SMRGAPLGPPRAPPACARRTPPSPAHARTLRARNLVHPGGTSRESSAPYEVKSPYPFSPFSPSREWSPPRTRTGGGPPRTVDGRVTWGVQSPPSFRHFGNFRRVVTRQPSLSSVFA